MKIKCGLEIHFQLNTTHKLFCNCFTTMREKNPVAIVERKQHVVRSELGEVDAAAQYEYLRNRTFYYQVFKNECCLVELDEEPPHDINMEALRTALQIARLLNCKIPEEIHVMRKTVIDGSNTSGFQRTAIVGLDGWVKYKNRKIEITQVCLEEDSAAKVSEEGGKVIYRLNRLGVPLVEVDTGLLEGFSSADVQAIAQRIGLIAKSTGKIKRGIGSIRQDINVSVEGGARVEIKGIQNLGLIAKVIETEVIRQLELIEHGKRVTEETRAAKPNGTTEFMRPLPGAERMYPESDIKPVQTSEIIRQIKLPEPLDKKIEKFRKKYKLSDELINGLLKSDYLYIFERLAKIIKPKIVANFFASTVRDLERREGVVFNLNDKKIVELFEALKRRKIVKEGLREVALYLIKNPEAEVNEAIKKLNLGVLSKKEVEKIAKWAISLTKNDRKAFNLTMSKIRGRARVADVKAVFKKLSQTKEKR